MSFFSKLLERKRSTFPDKHHVRQEPSVNVPESQAAVAYPPADPGIPFKTTDDILTAHQELLSRIKLTYGSDQLTFEKDLLSVVRRYAEYVHLLPATPDNYFNGPGGLLRMGLEIAFFSLQATDGQIFSGRTTISKRRNLEPRWRHATFLAGLCHEIHRTLSHIIVTNDKGNEWPPYLFSLSEWMQREKVSRFYVRWIPNAPEARSLAVFALPHIVSASFLHYLSEGNSTVVPHMMASISGMPVYRERNILDQLVRHAAALVIDCDLRSSADRYGKPLLGSHLERYLVDAMRRLIGSNAAWIPNDPKSRIWYTTSGMFLVWPNAAADICKLLETDRLPGIPKSSETILEILVSAGVIEPKSETTATWTIFPPHSNAAIESVKLSSPAILLTGLENAPAPLDVDLTKARQIEDSKKEKPNNISPENDAKQLSLPVDESSKHSGDATEKNTTNVAKDNATNAAISEPEASTAESKEASVAHQSALFALNAPLRLNTPVRTALSEIVATLNRPSGPFAACSIPAGLFVPLAELEQRRVDTSLAIRALTEVSMLIAPTNSTIKTIVHDFGGMETLGIIIAPRFISGFDPDHFLTMPTEGDKDACP